MPHSIYRTLHINILAVCVSTLTASEKHKEYTMHWMYPLPEHTTMFSTFYCNGNTSFAITCKDNIPEEIPHAMHTLFTVTKNNDDIVFQFIYGTPFEIPPFPEPRNSKDEQKQSSYDPLYHLQMPLQYENTKTQTITVSEIQNLLRTKQCAFYTGAGISALVIPTMAQLEKQLDMLDGTTKAECVIHMIYNALQNPATIATVLHNFFEACLYAKPTPAHKAIAEYFNLNSACMLFTENLDTLHEQSGSPALRIRNPHTFKEHITPAQLRAIDVIFCIGLSHDDRGFLAYYKHHNPNSIIIALALDQPNYLSENDYFIAGDVQEILPSLMDTAHHF